MANLKIENLDPATLEKLSADESSQVVGGCGGNSSSVITASDIVNDGGISIGGDIPIIVIGN